MYAAKTDWQVNSRSYTITGLAVANGDYFYLQWNSNEVTEYTALGPNDEFDEFAVDDIVVNATITNNPAPFIENIVFYKYPDTTETVFVTADISDLNNVVDVNNVFLKYGTTSGSYPNTLSMAFVSGVEYSVTIPADFNDLDSVYFIIEATDVGGATRTSEEQKYLVRNPVVVTFPYEEHFDVDLGDCYVFSVAGDLKEWVWNEDNKGGAKEFAEVTGYNSGDEEEDWLIFPGFDLRGVIIGNGFFYFNSYFNYGSDDVGSFSLVYSFNYSGTGDPTGSDWTELDFSRPIQKQKWYYSDIVDIPDSSGILYVAFKYVNPNYNYRTWRVDDFIFQTDFVADPEPTNYPTNFSASANNGSTVTTTWTNAVGEYLPFGYQIHANTTGDFDEPVDGIPAADDLNLRDGVGLRNIFHGGFESVTWTGLLPNTKYYFAIFPYSNSGDIINYKTDETAPEVDVTTTSGSSAIAGNVIITEFMSDPGDVSDSDGEWFELFNTTGSDINMDGWLIESSASEGTEIHSILNNGELLIEAYSFLVLGLNDDILTNGGVPVSYEYEDIFMSNTFDTLRIVTDAAVLMDFVEWGDGSVWENPTARSLSYHGKVDEDNNNGYLWSPAILRENGYTNPIQNPLNIFERDLASPGTNGMYQNLVQSTTWTGNGFWSEGNRVGSSNWSNGAPGADVDVIINGNVYIDLPAYLPAVCAKITVDLVVGTLVIPPNKALTTK